MEEAVRYLQGEIERCERLAAGINDEETEARLHALADAYREWLAKLEAGCSGLPPRGDPVSMLVHDGF
jgi:hypothetical protein